MPQQNNLSQYRHLHHQLIALKTLFQLIFVCYVIPSAVMSQQCSYQQGIDIFGNDLYVKYSSTIEQCCNACFIDANCKAWTYVPETQACWIKSGVGQIRQAVSQSSHTCFFYFFFFLFFIFLTFSIRFFYFTNILNFSFLFVSIDSKEKNHNNITRKK